MTGTSGRRLPPPFAYYDPDTRSLKTSQGTFDSDSTPSSPTLPPSGSMRSGALSARRRSALPTPAAASSSSPLLKTPTAQLAINGGSQHPEKRKAGGHGPTLADEVEHLLPTPAARDWKSGESNLIGTNARPLNEVAVNLLPTPRASDGEKGGPNQRGSKGDLALPAVAHRIGEADMPLLPTPLASDGGLGRGSSAGFGLRNESRAINRAATGGGTPSPSPAGSTPPDDEPHGQLTIAID